MSQHEKEDSEMKKTIKFNLSIKGGGLAIWESLKVDLLLQLRWFGHLTGMPPGRFLLELDADYRANH